MINTVEPAARDANPGYTPWNVGAGFVDAEAAVERAAAGEFARFDAVSLVAPDTAATSA